MRLDSYVRVPPNSCIDVTVGQLHLVWLIVVHGDSIHPHTSVSFPNIATYDTLSFAAPGEKRRCRRLKVSIIAVRPV